MSGIIRVVVADDSPFVCQLLKNFLESDPAIKVVKTVHNGKEAVESVKNLRPDVVTLDILMPVMNGLTALGRIMSECPTASIMISGVSREAAKATSQALLQGAVDFVLKYSSDSSIRPEELKREIIYKVKAAAKVKVIRSIPSLNSRYTGLGSWRSSDRRVALQEQRSKMVNFPLVIVGSSTGGPLAIREMLTAMKKNFNFSLVIVQHMPEGFTATLASQLDRIFPFPVTESRQGEALQPGTVYIAKGDHHLLLQHDGSFLLNKTPPIKGHRPSIDVTMQSAAQAFGGFVTGVILSGMGDDGTEGLFAIKQQGGSTYAQSPETCVIESMPDSAIRKNIVQRIGSPSEIGRWLN